MEKKVEGASSFVFGFKIGADGRAETLPSGIHDGTKDFWVWIGIDPENSDAARWLGSEAGLDPQVVKALLTVDVRPRCLSPSTARC